jgi:hypothetical protein
LLIGLVVLIVSALMARSSLDDGEVVEPELTPAALGPGAAARVLPGRVILELGQGEFQLHPSRPGEGVRVRARYDTESHELVDSFETLPDSTWVYHLRFRRTIPALQALFRALMGGDTETWIHVYLPPDSPIALDVLAKEGGMEADLGGLWLTAADIRFDKGGLSLDVGEPLREPLERLTIHGRMGGFQAMRLGNASPRELVVDCKMGGADLDLRGDWARDCDARLSIRMGGMSVTVPDDVAVEGYGAMPARGLRRTDAEVPVPVLRLTVSQSMGEVEVRRR